MSAKNSLDLIWGAEAIGREINLDERQAFYMLEKGLIPAKKVGRQWVTSRHALKEYFAEILGDPS